MLSTLPGAPWTSPETDDARHAGSASHGYTVLGPLSCKRDWLSPNGTLGVHRTPDWGFALASHQQFHPRQVNSSPVPLRLFAPKVGKMKMLPLNLQEGEKNASANVL